MNNVSFFNIKTDNDYGAVIFSDDCTRVDKSRGPYDCGSIQYNTGEVAYLNNGWEISILYFSGFLRALRLSLVSIVNVNFHHNLCYE